MKAFVRRVPGGAPRGFGAAAAIAVLAVAACTADPNASVSYEIGSAHSRAGEAGPPVRVFPRAAATAQTPTSQTPASLATAPAAASSAVGATQAGPLTSAALESHRAGTVSALTPARLKGMSTGELRAALGTPTLLGRDGPAQLWQYAGSGCVLHVFLYDDHGTFRVTYSELRVDDPEIANPPTCVESKTLPQAMTTQPSTLQATPSSTRATQHPTNPTPPGRI